jgi:hypothetical protein
MTIYTITDWSDGNTQIGERLASGAGESSFGLSIFDAKWHLSVLNNRTKCLRSVVAFADRTAYNTRVK